MNFQRNKTAYGKKNPNFYLFGPDFKDVIKRLSKSNGGEVSEFYQEVTKKKMARDNSKILDEFSDVIWQFIDYGNSLGINLKQALLHGYNKRVSRLNEVLNHLSLSQSSNLRSISYKDWNSLWQKAKNKLLVSN